MNPPVTNYQPIFDYSLHQLRSGLWVIGIFALIVALLGFIGPARFSGRNGRRHNKRVIALFVLAMLGIATAVTISNYRRMQRLQAHCGTTTGTITEKHWHSGKSHRWIYTYTYLVNGHTYTDNEVYPQSRRRDYEATATCYTVLYDTTDPGNAIMDLQEERNCDGGW